MTIIRSLGVSTLVALMSAHRTGEDARSADPEAGPLDETALVAMEAWVRRDEDRGFGGSRDAAYSR
jgi:hypothetical protein